MATTTVEPPAGPRVVKDGRGGARPGSGRPPTPETVEKRARVVAATQESGLSTWEWLDSVPKANWQDKLICYLWRTAPIIDLGSGKAASIERITHPFDLTYILKTHGSGGYRFDISEIPPDGSKQTRVRQFYENIFDVRFPPRIPYGTWVDDPRNADWAWAKPVLMEEAQRAAQPQEVQTPAQTLVDYLDVANKVKELSGNDDPSLSGVVIRMLENSQTALRDYQDPVKQVATLKSLMEFAGAGKKEDSGMSLVVEILREELRSVREDLRAQRAQTPADPLQASMGMIKGVADLLGGFGVNIGGGGGHMKTGDVIASTVGDVITKVIEKAADLGPAIIGAYQFGKQKELEIAIHGQKPAANPRPWEFQPGAPPPAATPAPISTAPPAAPPPAPLPTGPMTPQLLFAKWGNLIREIFPQLQDSFKHESGDDFRDWFLDRKGADLWAAFKKDATPELLTQLTQMAPDLKVIFTPEDKVLLFFANMLDDEEEEEDDEEPPLEAPTEMPNV